MMVREIGSVAASRLPIHVFSEHLRLGRGFEEDTREEALLEHYLRAALATIRSRTGRALIAREFSWSVSRWQEAGRQVLPVGPVIEVLSVDVIGATGEPRREGVTLHARGNEIFGALPVIPHGGVAELRFKAGFGEWRDVPADLRQAVLVLATQYFEDRGGEMGTALPATVAALISPWQQRRLGAVS
ncbi:hypothetical protein ACMA5I_12690 [Paracoccaceae bacterium GXU_MW_L88]